MIDLFFKVPRLKPVHSGVLSGAGMVFAHSIPPLNKQFLTLEPPIRRYSVVRHSRSCRGPLRSVVLNNSKSDERRDKLIQSAKALRVDSMASNCTGLEVFRCTTIARAATRSP